MGLVALLPDASTIVRLQAHTADAALLELAAALARRTGLAADVIVAGLRERESLGSTGLGRGLALPHTKADIAGSAAVIGLAPDGLEFGAPDEQPVRVFVALVSSLQPSEHLRALALVSRAFADASLVDRLLAAGDAEQAHALLR
jgi:mannitol/fructose-specific phosphotransferase system IIA component (Ntr-type)